VVFEEVGRDGFDALFDEPVDDPEAVLFGFVDAGEVVDFDVVGARAVDPDADGPQPMTSPFSMIAWQSIMY